MSAYKKIMANTCIVAGLLMVCLVFIAGLASAGTLTVHLEHSLEYDKKVDSIIKAELISRTENKTATIINGQARFNLTANDTGDQFIRINDLASDLIPTRIDDPTKDINQVRWR